VGVVLLPGVSRGPVRTFDNPIDDNRALAVREIGDALKKAGAALAGDTTLEQAADGLFAGAVELSAAGNRVERLGQLAAAQKVKVLSARHVALAAACRAAARGQPAWGRVASECELLSSALADCGLHDFPEEEGAVEELSLDLERPATLARLRHRVGTTAMNLQFVGQIGVSTPPEDFAIELGQILAENDPQKLQWLALDDPQTLQLAMNGVAAMQNPRVQQWFGYLASQPTLIVETLAREITPRFLADYGSDLADYAADFGSTPIAYYGLFDCPAVCEICNNRILVEKVRFTMGTGLNPTEVQILTEAIALIAEIAESKELVLPGSADLVESILESLKAVDVLIVNKHRAAAHAYIRCQHCEKTSCYVIWEQTIWVDKKKGWEVIEPPAGLAGAVGDHWPPLSQWSDATRTAFANQLAAEVAAFCQGALE
jgi:hypothetical protein